MKHLIALCLLATAALTAQSQQMDMDAMMKWGAADLVHYHIVGAYQGRPHIASDGSGTADVSDRVVLDFNWKLSEMKLVGQPTFQNSKTTLANPKDREPSCLPPVLEGEYEHYQVTGIKDGLNGMLELQVETHYPVVQVAQFCTASRKPVPAKTQSQPEVFVVVSPVNFGMPLPDSDDLRISADKKSLVVKRNGWTWTYTPSIVAK